MPPKEYDKISVVVDYDLPGLFWTAYKSDEDSCLIVTLSQSDKTSFVLPPDAIKISNTVFISTLRKDEDEGTI
jgi:hypothetical protein